MKNDISTAEKKKNYIRELNCQKNENHVSALDIDCICEDVKIFNNIRKYDEYEQMEETLVSLQRVTSRFQNDIDGLLKDTRVAMRDEFQWQKEAREAARKIRHDEFMKNIIAKPKKKSFKERIIDFCGAIIILFCVFCIANGTNELLMFFFGDKLFYLRHILVVVSPMLIYFIMTKE